jgi:hypothetical protein
MKGLNDLIPTVTLLKTIEASRNAGTITDIREMATRDRPWTPGKWRMN